MSVGQMLLRTICAAAASIAVCAGSVAAIAPAFAADGATGGGSGDGGDTGGSGETTVQTVTDATFAWSLNKESNYRAYAPGTFNFLSAGIVDKTSASDNVEESEWKQSDGDVSIEKLQRTTDADGKTEETYVPATWAGLRTTPEGKDLPGAGVADGEDTGNRVVLSHGEGTFDADKDDASISWDGAFTVIYYSGMTQWYAKDVKLNVTGGKGTVTATLGGWASDMNDQSKYEKLEEEQDVEIATLTDVDVQDDGVIVTPDFAEIDVAGNGTKVKSWPKPFIEFMTKVGTAPYWYGSGGNADARKAPKPITVGWNGGEPDNGGGGDNGNNGNGGDNGSGDNGNNGNGGNNGSGGGNGDNNNGDNNGGTESGDTVLSGVTLRWGMNDETNSAAYSGGCNFLSAGVAGNTGSSRTWDESLYKSSDGNVTIQKPDANGNWTEATWASKCLARDGSSVTMGKRADGRSINTESQVVLSNGTGTVKADGTTTITWKGSWTVAYYGGMTYWSVTDPTLTLAANGTGSLTATASGYGADMNDASKWLTLTPQQIHVADFTGGNAVNVTQALADHGFTATPDYLGVAVSASGDHGSQAAKDDTNASYWGSFPQSFVDFQLQTGQSAYWYTSNSARDFAKPTLPLYVQYDSSYTVTAGEGSPAAATAAGGARSTTTGSTGAKTGSSTTKKTTASEGNAASDGDAAGDDTAGGVVSAAGDVADGTMLIADNARTIALGSGSVAAAAGLPLAFGWFVRRRLGLDAAAELDKRLGL